MILSVSRRTDIPAYYSEWFFNRLKEGFCYVQNPMNPKLVQKVLINPEVVDAMVFWTKNPQPMFSDLHKLSNYPYYFQITITSYATDIESHVPKKKHIIEAVKNLSDMLGKERIIWRYDPIFLNDAYTLEYHIKYFEILAKALSPSATKVIISFIDYYRKISANWKQFNMRGLTEDEKHIVCKAFSEIAHTNNLEMCACCEDIGLMQYNIKPSKCIDGKLLERISGYKLNLAQDKGQRANCGCAESVDIGVYNTCRHDCKYCYATHTLSAVAKNFEKYNPLSPLLCKKIPDGITIKDKKQKSIKDARNLLK